MPQQQQDCTSNRRSIDGTKRSWDSYTWIPKLPLLFPMSNQLRRRSHWCVLNLALTIYVNKNNIQRYIPHVSSSNPFSLIFNVFFPKSLGFHDLQNSHRVVPKVVNAKLMNRTVQFHDGFCWWYIELVNGIITHVYSWGAPPCIWWNTPFSDTPHRTLEM